MGNFFYFWLIDSYSLVKDSHSKYLKYIFRFILDWRSSYEWSIYLNNAPQMFRWKEKYKKDLYLKLQSSYLSNNFCNELKVINLKSHYDWFFKSFHESYYAAQPLAHLFEYIIDNENKDKLCLSFLFKSDFCKEGECGLILTLNDEIQYTLTFSYVILNTKPTFFIGGLQGGR